MCHAVLFIKFRVLKFNKIDNCIERKRVYQAAWFCFDATFKETNYTKEACTTKHPILSLNLNITA